LFATQFGESKYQLYFLAQRDLFIIPKIWLESPVLTVQENACFINFISITLKYNVTD